MTDDATRKTFDELVRRVEDLEAENARLRGLLGVDRDRSPTLVAPWEPTLFAAEQPAPHVSVTQRSTREEKVKLFRALFRGRDDVYATRWENARTGKSGWSPAVKGGWANVRRPDRELLPWTDEVVVDHLGGGLHAGLYPLFRNDTCQVLVCDFDGDGWVLDALAYFDAATSAGIPSALEVSRSGAGGHVWVFFDSPVPATTARRIGAYLVREAMTVRAELDLVSYDRLFPAQDFLPKEGLGNLIALPLQGACRKRGTTLFFDPKTCEPWPDQWEFLSGIGRLSRSAATSLAESLGEVAAGPDVRTYRRALKESSSPPPSSIPAVAGAMLAINRIGVPPALLAALKHAASLHNPDFYEKERNRFWTGSTPRFIRCYGETLDQLLLPRGVRAQAETLTAEAGSRLDVREAYPCCAPVAHVLQPQLRPEQREAVDNLMLHDLGVLVAPPGAGKTVMACAVIARRGVPTIVIVDRQPLVEQWRERLMTDLGLDRRQVGELGTNRKPSGVVDIAMAQSLARRDDLAEATAGYGLVVVDECHHVPAVTFERAVRQIRVRCWLGLTATPYRRDGLQAMMAMYCGPIRHRMAAPAEAQLLHREVVVHETAHRSVPGEHISEVFRAVVADQDRTRWICDDIAVAAALGRNCLVLTRWTEHLDLIAEDLAHRSLVPLVLRGGMGKKARKAVVDRLAEPDLRGAILLATASFLGEGFDCPALDTVFLAFPIRFKGASSSTWGGSSARLRERHTSSFTTTWTSKCRCWLACTRSEPAPMSTSDSLPPDGRPERRERYMRELCTNGRRSTVGMQSVWKLPV